MLTTEFTPCWSRTRSQLLFIVYSNLLTQVRHRVMSSCRGKGKEQDGTPIMYIIICNPVKLDKEIP